MRLGSGFMPPFRVGQAAPIAAICAALLITGCASTQEQAQQSHVRGPTVAAAAEVELEDDGLPPQVNPPKRPRGPDDPREPFSPNYGTVPTPAAPTRATVAAIAPVERSFAIPALRASATADDIASAMAAFPVQVSSLDEDAIIARAIAAHEMRRP